MLAHLGKLEAQGLVEPHSGKLGGGVIRETSNSHLHVQMSVLILALQLLLSGGTRGVLLIPILGKIGVPNRRCSQWSQCGRDLPRACLHSQGTGFT